MGTNKYQKLNKNILPKEQKLIGKIEYAIDNDNFIISVSDKFIAAFFGRTTNTEIIIANVNKITMESLINLYLLLVT